MDFSLTQEQSQLRDSARRFLADRTGGLRQGTDLLWSAFADLGWLGLSLPEECGGMGLTSVEVAILAEELGRHCIVEPWVATVVLASDLLATTRLSNSGVASLLTGVADGTMRPAFAHIEKGARGCLPHVGMRATRTETGWVIDGLKTAIIGGAAITHYLVSARLDGQIRESRGIALFLMPRAKPGLVSDVHQAVDGSEITSLTLTQVQLGHDALLQTDAAGVIEGAVDRALTAWCAESVGAMDALLQSTIEYTRVRVQFGRPLASNQVIRHRLADMAIALEEARSLALKATLTKDDRTRAVAAAKVKVGRSARYVAEQAVQLHGAMGVTDELRIGAYLRRLLALNAIYGTPEEHLRHHSLLLARRRADEAGGRLK